MVDIHAHIFASDIAELQFNIDRARLQQNAISYNQNVADCSFITETLEARQASGKYNQNVSQNVSHAPEARQATRQTEAERCESRYASI